MPLSCRIARDDLLVHPRGKLKIGQAKRRVGRIENSDHQFLSVQSRGKAHAVIHAPFALRVLGRRHERGEMPFLNGVAARDVDVAEDLDQRRELDAHRAGHPHDVDHLAVDAQASLKSLQSRLDVDVGRVAAKRGQQQQ